MAPNLLDRIDSLFDPLSHATVPLLNGLSRRGMLRLGAEQYSARLAGVSVSYYRLCRRRAPRPGQPEPPPLLLIHGLGDSGVTWALVAPLLAVRHDVYAVDLPGYGSSGLPTGHRYATIDEMTTVLEAFLREVVGRPAVAVGNSMGGWLAVRLAYAAPRLLRGVVLVNAGGAILEGRPSWDPFVGSLQASDLRSARAIVRQVLGFIPPVLGSISARGMQDLFTRVVVREFVAAAQENDFLTADDLRGLPVPAALVWGLRDRFLPGGSLEFFRANLPDAPARLIRHCGHLPQRERPLSVATFVSRFATNVAR